MFDVMSYCFCIDTSWESRAGLEGRYTEGKYCSLFSTLKANTVSMLINYNALFLDPDMGLCTQARTPQTDSFKWIF